MQMKNESSLPNINARKESAHLSQFDNLDNSKESEVENKPSVVTPTIMDDDPKSHSKQTIKTYDNHNTNIEGTNIHKKVTLSDSDNKPFPKYTNKKSSLKNDETPFDHPKHTAHEDEKHDKHDKHDVISKVSVAQNEIIFKERKHC
jgi:hypothetical protein